MSGFLNQFFSFMKSRNLPVDLTPIVAAHILNKVSCRGWPLSKGYKAVFSISYCANKTVVLQSGITAKVPYVLSREVLKCNSCKLQC